eukprot:scaffold29108_cov45-Isochrysis_galbana.AAC.1
MACSSGSRAVGIRMSTNSDGVTRLRHVSVSSLDEAPPPVNRVRSHAPGSQGGCDAPPPPSASPSPHRQRWKTERVRPPTSKECGSWSGLKQNPRAGV